MMAALLKAVGLAMAAAVVLPWDISLIPGPMIRMHPQTDGTGPLDEPGYSRRSLQFPAIDGTLCEGWLYSPKAPATDPPPVVVMAHGLVRTECVGLGRSSR